MIKAVTSQAGDQRQSKDRNYMISILPTVHQIRELNVGNC